MGHQIYNQAFILEFIKKNPGLSHLQMKERLGHDVYCILKTLLKKRKIRREIGLCGLTKGKTYKYYLR